MALARDGTIPAWDSAAVDAALPILMSDPDPFVGRMMLALDDLRTTADTAQADIAKLLSWVELGHKALGIIQDAMPALEQALRRSGRPATITDPATGQPCLLTEAIDTLVAERDLGPVIDMLRPFLR